MLFGPMDDPTPETDMVTIRCPGCGQRFKVGPELEGKMVECGTCDHRFRVEEGVIECEEAARLVPRNPEIRSAAGEGYFRLNRLADSERHLRKAIEIEPRLLPPRFNLCAVLIRTQRFAEAQEILIGLTRDAPDHPQVRFLQERFTEARSAAGSRRPPRGSRARACS